MATAVQNVRWFLTIKCFFWNLYCSPLEAKKVFHRHKESWVIGTYRSVFIITQNSCCQKEKLSRLIKAVLVRWIHTHQCLLSASKLTTDHFPYADVVKLMRARASSTHVTNGPTLTMPILKNSPLKPTPILLHQNSLFVSRSTPELFRR